MRVVQAGRASVSRAADAVSSLGNGTLILLGGVCDASKSFFGHSGASPQSQGYGHGERGCFPSFTYKARGRGKSLEWTVDQLPQESTAEESDKPIAATLESFQQGKLSAAECVKQV